MDILNKSIQSCERSRFFTSCLVVSSVLFVLHLIIIYHIVYDRAPRTFKNIISNTSELTILKSLRSKMIYYHRKYNEAISEQIFTSKIETYNDLSSNTSNVRSNLQMCPKKSPLLSGPLTVYRDSPSYEKLEELYPNVSSGGRHKPPECISRHKVAIVIPYRNRDIHLRTFLKNIHPFLQRQQLNYGIYVVEQAEGSKFNRGLLMNIGYAEASKIYGYQCFAFHDVDLIPQDDRNIYSCPNQPRHLSAAIDKFGYRLPYGSIFGGAVMMTKEQFQKVNGFSNKYFGWGGEDDEMWKRVKKKGYKVIRYPMKIARYKMMKHGNDKGNEKNPQRFMLLRRGEKIFETDGINSLKYKVLQIEYLKLYTRILVSVDEKEIMKNEFLKPTVINSTTSGTK